MNISNVASMVKYIAILQLDCSYRDPQFFTELNISMKGK